LQKAIRRNDVRNAGYFGLELFHSGYCNYLWKRLFTISAEDCAGVITKEIDALYNGYLLVNKNNKEKVKKGRIFASKAIILLCQHPKNRDSDHLQNLIYDKKNIDEHELEQYMESVRISSKKQIPLYAFDCHTAKGKRMGKTKAEFFREEMESLNPRELGLFDSFVEDAQ
jgi:replication-associated recombination protein RarA